MSDDLLEYAKHVYDVKRQVKQQGQRFCNFLQDFFKAVNNDATLRNPQKSDAEKIHASNELAKFLDKLIHRRY